MLYELWQRDGGAELSFIPTSHPQKAFLTEGFNKIWEVEADTWTEAWAKRNEHMGWEPYQPMNEGLEGEVVEPPDFQSGD